MIVAHSALARLARAKPAQMGAAFPLMGGGACRANSRHHWPEPAVAAALVVPAGIASTHAALHGHTLRRLREAAR
ncbi:MAG: hypothetical protein AAF371_09775 [Pseudomonadota bacterium]